MNLVDINAHILPSLGDGPISVNESIRMLDLAYEESIRSLVATPHFGNYYYGSNQKITEELFSYIKEYAKHRYPNMDIHLANEVFYSESALDSLKSGAARTLFGTNYVLVDFSVFDSMEKMYQGVVLLSKNGYRPVIANIEKYECLAQGTGLKAYEDLIDRGACIQCCSRTLLLDKHDKKYKRATRLMENGMMHFIASDCHDSYFRKPTMKSAIKEMLEIIDVNGALRILVLNTKMLINNERIL